MYVLARTFNKHVIKLPSKLSATDTSHLLEEAGRTNGVWPRDSPLCTTRYSEGVRCDSNEHATGKKWAEAKMEPN